MKNEKGITLIALVITIIILLILAGAAVSIGLSGDSVFSKANEAKESWNRGVNEENTTVSNYIAYIDQYTGATPTPIVLPAGWSNTAVADVVTETSEVEGVTKERKVPIPAGFKASIYNDTVANETTIADGLVIYETTSDLTTVNHETAMTTYNQYVWIPVDNINDMIMCDSHTSSSDCDIVIDEETGKIYCQNHMNVADAELTDTSTKFLCGRLYAKDGISTNVDGKYVHTTNITFDSTAKASQTYSANSGHREPDAVPGDNSDTHDGSSLNSIKNETGTSISGGNNENGVNKILIELKRQFNNMAKSVAIYGGFYIARYEVGYDATTCTSKKGQIVMNASTDENNGATKWYGLYNHIIGIKSGTTSQMIWGSQYDQVIKFIGSEAQTGHTDRNLCSDSSSGTTSGTTPLDKMKNIYDLEGNYYEWTAKAYGTSERAIRGGGYASVSNGYFYSVAHKYSREPSYTYAVYSSRQSLYVQL